MRQRRPAEALPLLEYGVNRGVHDLAGRSARLRLDQLGEVHSVHVDGEAAPGRFGLGETRGDLLALNEEKLARDLEAVA